MNYRECCDIPSYWKVHQNSNATSHVFSQVPLCAFFDTVHSRRSCAFLSFALGIASPFLSCQQCRSQRLLRVDTIKKKERTYTVVLLSARVLMNSRKVQFFFYLYFLCNTISRIVRTWNEMRPGDLINIRGAKYRRYRDDSFYQAGLDRKQRGRVREREREREREVKTIFVLCENFKYLIYGIPGIVVTFCFKIFVFFAFNI